MRNRWAAALLLALLPAALQAEPKPTPPAAVPAAAEAVAPPAGDAAAEAVAPGASNAAAVPEAVAPERLEGFTGLVQKVTADGLLVSRTGTTTDPKAPLVVRFAGGLGVRVSGEGKNSWMSLRQGDVVLVSYVKGPPHRARKVNVLRATKRSKQAARSKAAVLDSAPTKPRQRTFIGYVKRKQGDELIVMQPGAPDPRVRLPETKAFIRQDSSVVEVLRDSWDDLKKGDRLKITFQKGNPRPVDLIQVIRRGGEEPLPPGTATRLFDPRFDSSVKDVDGIGETGPVPKVRKTPPSKTKVKIPRKSERKD